MKKTLILSLILASLVPHLAQNPDCGNLSLSNVNIFSQGCAFFPASSQPLIIDQSGWQLIKNSLLFNGVYSESDIQMIVQDDLIDKDMKVRSASESILLKPGFHVLASGNHSAQLVIAEPSCYQTEYSCTNCPPVYNSREKEGWSLVFYDEFNSNKLDTTKWRYNIGTLANIDEVNSPEYAHECYARGADGQNVTLSGGNLEIKVIHENYYGGVPYYDPEYYHLFTNTNGLIETIENFHYGYYEARMKIPTGDLHWPSFWIFGPPGEEIDVMENVGHENGINTIGTNFHFNDGQFYDTRHDFCETQKNDEDGDVTFWSGVIQLDNSYNIQTDWITMGCLYEPEKITIYVNNQIAREFKCMNELPRLAPNGIGSISHPLSVKFGVGLQPGYEGMYNDMLDNGTLSDPFIIDYFRYYMRNEDLVLSQGDNYDRTIPLDIIPGDGMDELVLIDVNPNSGGIKTYDVNADQEMSTFYYSSHPEYIDFRDSEDRIDKVQFYGRDMLLFQNVSQDNFEGYMIVDPTNGAVVKEFNDTKSWQHFSGPEDNYFINDIDDNSNNTDELILFNRSQEIGEPLFLVIDLATGDVVKEITYDPFNNPNHNVLSFSTDLNDKSFIKDVNGDGKYSEVILINSNVSNINDPVLTIYELNSESVVFNDMGQSNYYNWIEPDDRVMIGNVDFDSNLEVVVYKRNPIAYDICRAVDLSTNNLDYSVTNNQYFHDFAQYCDVIELVNILGQTTDELVLLNTSTNGDFSVSSEDAVLVYDFVNPILPNNYNYTALDSYTYQDYFTGGDDYKKQGNRVFIADFNPGIYAKRKNLCILNTKPSVSDQSSHGLAYLKTSSIVEKMSLIPNGTPSIYSGEEHQFSSWFNGNDPNLTFCYGINSLLNKGTIDATIEASSNVSSNKVIIYPNPTQGKINFTFSGCTPENFILTNEIGQKIASESLFNNQYSFDLSGYPTGLYIAQFVYRDEVIIKKIIVNDFD